jgi:hypothetical protein
VGSLGTFHRWRCDGCGALEETTEDFPAGWVDVYPSGRYSEKLSLCSWTCVAEFADNKMAEKG